MTYKTTCKLEDFPLSKRAEEVVKMLHKYDEANGTSMLNAVATYMDDVFNENEEDGMLVSKQDIDDFIVYDVPNMPEESWSEVFDD